MPLYLCQLLASRLCPVSEPLPAVLCGCRDGVSEGQFQGVLDLELSALRKVPPLPLYRMCSNVPNAPLSAALRIRGWHSQQASVKYTQFSTALVHNGAQTMASVYVCSRPARRSGSGPK